MTRTVSRVVLLYGGTWEERAVSISSALPVDAALRGAGLEVARVRWDQSGWTLVPNEGSLEDPGRTERPLVLLEELIADGVGIVFNALHGGAGEDGSLSAIMEIAGVPFSGATVLPSAISHHKGTFRVVAEALGLEVSPGCIVTVSAWETHAKQVLTHVSTEVGLPAVLKPVCGGSSIGAMKVSDAEELGNALDSLLSLNDEILVERFIPGRELTISCLGVRPGEPPQVLPPIEIQPLTDSGIFDTEAKYNPKNVREIVPAPLDPDLWKHLSEQAARLHLQLDLGAMSRSDLILSADGPIWLETQTIPGLTESSLFPQAAAAAGIDFTTLLRRLLDYAISAHLFRSANTEGIRDE